MKTRALELHASSNIWNPDGLIEVLDLMAGVGLNTLVLHEVGIMERLVYPGRLFGAGDEPGIHRRYRGTFRELYRLDPGRRSRPYQHLSFMRWLARRAAERGIALFLNNKELWYPDSLFRLRPDLLVDGSPCPTAPGWIEFLETKYDELLTDFPELAGTITSPGTGESRLSFSAGWCTCDRCRRTDPADWYAAVIDAIHAVAKRHAKTLVVRDFVFTRATQDELADGLRGSADDIVICLKNTPHDYYPTFPDNPRIGAMGAHPQWVELDAMGQYFGWGIAPAVMTEDIRRRLDHARASGVDGVLIRIDWEGLEGHSALRTFNALNVHAAAALAADPGTPDELIYRSWAAHSRAVRDDATPEVADEAMAWLRDLLERTWPVTAKTLFAHDCVFSDSSQFPVSIDHAFWLAEEKNSLRDWDPTKDGALSPDPGNVERLLEEKRKAVREVANLVAKADAGHPGLDAGWHAELRRHFRVFQEYVGAFDLAARAVFAGRHVRDADAVDPRLHSVARDAVREMREVVERLRRDGLADWHPAAAVLSADRLECLMEDVTTAIDR